MKARYQGRIVQLPDANREIDIFLEQVDLALVQIDVDGYLGVRAHEIGDRLNQLTGAESQRHGDANPARNLAFGIGYQLFGFRQIREHPDSALVEGPTGIGQGLAARGSLQ